MALDMSPIVRGGGRAFKRLRREKMGHRRANLPSHWARTKAGAECAAPAWRSAPCACASCRGTAPAKLPDGRRFGGIFVFRWDDRTINCPWGTDTPRDGVCGQAGGIGQAGVAAPVATPEAASRMATGLRSPFGGAIWSSG